MNGKRKGEELAVKHKSHSRLRQTVCGIKYDDVTDITLFFNRLRGHWRLVTCKRCLKARKRYEKSLKK